MMGASFRTMSLPGDTSDADVRKAFQKAQDQDRYENGHSYSGGFGMASGLILISNEPHKSWQAACDHLDNRCQKWEEAIGVKFLDDDGKVRWLIGAWCAE